MVVLNTGGVKEAWFALRGEVTGERNAVDEEAADPRGCEHSL